VTNIEYICPYGRDTSDLLAYVEGDLDQSARLELKRHLKKCPACAAEVASLARIGMILRTHSDAFHPDEDALHRFVANGEDPGKLIEAHLASCAQCREDVDLFREMISAVPGTAPASARMPRSFVRRLDLMYQGEKPPGPAARIGNFLWDLLKLPVRAPVLALGTAAAVLVIVVVTMPMWRTFKEVAQPRRVGPVEESRVVGETIPVETEPGERLREVGKARRSHPMDKETTEKRPVAPALKAPAPSPLPGPRERDEQDQAMARTKRDLSHRPSKLRAAPVEREARRKHGKSGLMEAYVSKDSRPSMGAAEVPLQASPSSGGKSRGGLIPVRVSVIDSQGRQIPWLSFEPPPGLKSRYSFLGDVEPKKEALSAQRAPLEFNMRESGRRAGQGRLVLVRVTKSGDLYDVRASLFDSGSERETKVIEDFRVPEDQVRAKVHSMVMSVLQEW
jgi:anti-sigma factor RsiW